MSVLKVFLAVLISDLLLYLGKTYLGINEIWLGLVVCILVPVLMLLKKNETSGGTVKQIQTKKEVERIVNLQDDSLGPVFDPNQFRGYTLMSDDGNDKTYTNAEGSVLVTRRTLITVNSQQPASTSSGKYTGWGKTIIAAAAAYLIWVNSIYPL